MEGSGDQRFLTTSDAATLAKCSYIWGGSSLSVQDKRLEIQKKLQPLKFVHQEGFSDRQLSTFYRSRDRHLHIAHKGTQPDSGFGMLDLVSDVRLGLAGENKDYQFQYRMTQSERIYRHFRPRKFTMSGHSLGGATMIYALENSRLLLEAINQADSFNAGATPVPKINWNYLNPFMRKFEFQKQRKLRKVLTHHRMENDAVSAGFTVRPPNGEVRTYPLDPAIKPEDRAEFDQKGMVGVALTAHGLEDMFGDPDAIHMQQYSSKTA